MGSALRERPSQGQRAHKATQTRHFSWGRKGYDVKALRTIVRMRKQDPNERAEAETILETYMQALGMI